LVGQGRIKPSQIADVDPCKVVHDPEFDKYRPAEPHEIQNAEDGYVVQWEATEALLDLLRIIAD
jgi:hypothetical protein